jgi:hypothetical protein
MHNELEGQNVVIAHCSLLLLLFRYFPANTEEDNETFSTGLWCHTMTAMQQNLHLSTDETRTSYREHNPSSKADRHSASQQFRAFNGKNLLLCLQYLAT